MKSQKKISIEVGTVSGLVGVNELRRLAPKLNPSKDYKPRWAKVGEAATYFGCSKYTLYYGIREGLFKIARNGSNHMLVDIGGVVTGKLPCSCCDGTGTLSGDKTCPVCKGTGERAKDPLLEPHFLAKLEVVPEPPRERITEQKVTIPPHWAKTLKLLPIELKKLTELAEENCRDPEQQARWILKQALRKKVGAE